MQTSSIGRAVHFVAGDGRHMSATISYVYTPYSGKVPREPEDEQRWQTLCNAQTVDVHVLWPDNENPVRAVTALRPKGITVEYVDSDRPLFGLYVNGQSTTNVQRIIYRNWRVTDVETRITTSTTDYGTTRGYDGHTFQADHCYKVPVYDVLDGEHVQNYGRGMVADGVSNYVASGLSTRKARWQRLCLFGMWPFSECGRLTARVILSRAMG